MQLSTTASGFCSAAVAATWIAEIASELMARAKAPIAFAENVEHLIRSHLVLAVRASCSRRTRSSSCSSYFLRKPMETHADASRGACHCPIIADERQDIRIDVIRVRGINQQSGSGFRLVEDLVQETPCSESSPDWRVRCALRRLQCGLPQCVVPGSEDYC